MNSIAAIVFVIGILLCHLIGEAQGLRFHSLLNVRRRVSSRQLNYAGTLQDTNSVSRQAPCLQAYESVYQDTTSAFDSDGVVSTVTSKALEIMFNPVALVFVIYFVAVGYTQLGNLAKSILKFITQERSDIHTELVVDTPFQVFECEKCHMQMRPAKGRAQKILTREKFRCARCGARAASYFDIDDLDDPRAIARRERLEREALEEECQDDTA